MQSRFLKIAVGALAITGTSALLFFLNESVQPDKKTPKRPSINVAALMPGQALTVETELLRYFVVKLAANELHVLAVPVDHGAVAMPDLHWWKPFMNCKDFGLDTASRATMESRFRCSDANQPEAWGKRWQWDIYGKHIIDSDAAIDGMYQVRYEREGDNLVFTGLAPH